MLKNFYILGFSFVIFWMVFLPNNLFAQNSNSKNTVIDDLLSTYDVCEELGYFSESEVKQKTVTLNSEISNLTSQLSAALDDIERLKKSSKSGSSKVVDNSLEIELLTNENNFLKDELKSLLSSAGLSNDAIDLYQKLREQVVSCNNSQIELKNEMTMLSSEAELKIQDLRKNLENALVARLAAEALAKSNLEEAKRKQLLLNQAEQEIDNLKNRNPNKELDIAKAQAALLNQQLSEVRKQLGQLDELLSLSEERDQERKAQLKNVGARLNQALARIASEKRKRRKLEENDKQVAIENMGDYLVEYRKSVQNLLNKQSCNAGVEDGVFGTQTLSAARKFSKIIYYNFDPTRLYEKDFYNRLVSATAKCGGPTFRKFVGSWSVVAVCKDGTVTAKADIYPLDGFFNKYIVKYINNFGARASGYANVIKDGIHIKLDFEEGDFSDEAKLYPISDNLLRGTSPNCKVEATRN